MLSSLGDSRAISFIMHANTEVEDIMLTSTCHAGEVAEVIHIILSIVLIIILELNSCYFH
jgi:hypothetical protein